jgi:hypothetical protein
MGLFIMVTLFPIPGYFAARIQSVQVGRMEKVSNLILVKSLAHCQSARPMHECKLSPKVLDFVAMGKSLANYCISNSHERA